MRAAGCGQSATMREGAQGRALKIQDPRRRVTRLRPSFGGCCARKEPRCGYTKALAQRLSSKSTQLPAQLMYHPAIQLLLRRNVEYVRWARQLQRGLALNVTAKNRRPVTPGSRGLPSCRGVCLEQWRFVGPAVGSEPKSAGEDKGVVHSTVKLCSKRHYCTNYIQISSHRRLDLLILEPYFLCFACTSITFCTSS